MLKIPYNLDLTLLFTKQQKNLSISREEKSQF